MEIKEDRREKSLYSKGKVKGIKNRTRWWNKEVYGWLDMKVDDEVNEVNELDMISKNCE